MCSNHSGAMEYGVWSWGMEYGVWSMGYVVQSMETYGVWSM